MTVWWVAVFLAISGLRVVKAQDRALFREHLNAAAQSADPVASAQARALLQREDELFGPAEAAQPTPSRPRR